MKIIVQGLTLYSIVLLCFAGSVSAEMEYFYESKNSASDTID